MDNNVLMQVVLKIHYRIAGTQTVMRYDSVMRYNKSSSSSYSSMVHGDC